MRRAVQVGGWEVCWSQQTTPVMVAPLQLLHLITSRLWPETTARPLLCAPFARINEDFMRRRRSCRGQRNLCDAAHVGADAADAVDVDCARWARGDVPFLLREGVLQGDDALGKWARCVAMKRIYFSPQSANRQRQHVSPGGESAMVALCAVPTATDLSRIFSSSMGFSIFPRMWLSLETNNIVTTTEAVPAIEIPRKTQSLRQ